MALFAPLRVSRHKLVLALVIVFCVILCSDTGLAQEGRKPQPEKAKMPAEGKLLGAVRGVLQVETQDGAQWLVMMPNPRALSVVAKADASWLQPGMLIRFTSRFDRKGEAIAPVKSLSVVTLREDVRFGVFAEQRPLGNAGIGLFTDAADASKKKKPERPKPPKPEEIDYTVVGKITKIRKGEVTVAAGRLLRFELDAEPTIDVDVADISVAQPGSSIRLDAWYSPKQPGRAVANRVTVVVEPLLKGQDKKRAVATGASKSATEADGSPKNESKDADDEKAGDGQKDPDDDSRA